MLKLNLTKDALDFWDKLDAKLYRQVGRKVLSLLLNAYPQDSQVLRGAPNYFRVDCGEYRIIYSIDDDVLKIALIGKRNDGEIYDIFKRK
jgi:mRNA interferase RelE/StbE